MVLEEPTFSPEQKAIIGKFCRETGYGSRDILSLNFDTHKFMTRNGGLYEMIDGEIKWLKGPAAHVEDRGD